MTQNLCKTFVHIVLNLRGDIIEPMEQDKKLDTLIEAVGTIATRLDRHENRFNQQDRKIDTLTDTVGNLVIRIDKQDNKIDTLADTVENLAIMVKEGFEHMVTKDDIRSLIDCMEFIRADVSDIKMTQKPLEHTQVVQEKEIDELKMRVDKIEDKVFVS